MLSVFLLSYRNTHESLGELEEAMETLACGSCSHSFSRSPKLSLVFLYLNRNMVHVFYFLSIGWCDTDVWYSQTGSEVSPPREYMYAGSHTHVFLEIYKALFSFYLKPKVTTASF